MKTLHVKTETNEYPIYIKNNFDDLYDAFRKSKLNMHKVCIICDSNTEKLYLKDFIYYLNINNDFGNICFYTFEAGENSKNLNVIYDFYKFFLENNIDRKSVIIALGGGVVGDMAGFAASTYMRGLKYIQIPTTLLSQVDSSVGGKTGVDFMGNKNLIGAFYQPEFVYINTSTLNTLPKNEFSAGMAEAIKYGYIIDKQYLSMIEENKENIKSLDYLSLQKLIYGACSSKAYVVSKDEKEYGLREILNFGHTFGHSIESLCNFKLLHGECVSIGMIAGLYLSYKKGNINHSDVENAINLQQFFDLPVKVKWPESKSIFKQMFHDKKSTNNKINLVVLLKIGEAYTEKNVLESEIIDAIEYILA